MRVVIAVDTWAAHWQVGVDLGSGACEIYRDYVKVGCACYQAGGLWTHLTLDSPEVARVLELAAEEMRAFDPVIRERQGRDG